CAPPDTNPQRLARAHKPADLHVIELDSRETGLWECFQTVRVVLKKKDRTIYERVVEMPDASKTQARRSDVGTQNVHALQLHFSNPVTTTKDGSARVDPKPVSPGYREIRLDWAKK